MFVDDSTIDFRDEFHTVAVPQFIGGILADTGLIDLLRWLDDIMVTLNRTGVPSNG